MTDVTEHTSRVLSQTMIETTGRKWKKKKKSGGGLRRGKWLETVQSVVGLGV